MERIRVAVIDEHEVFRRGIVACLAEDARFFVVVHRAHGPLADQVDVAIASALAATRERFRCPVVVCSAGSSLRRFDARDNTVLGVLPRSSLTPRQLLAAVHAAAAGFRIDVDAHPSSSRLNDRTVEVLRLLAEGASTQEIAESLRYSERTIKGLIQELEQELGARSRAHAVAEGIRQGYI
jgi:DNA-binding NarL/FixJ family response regulator